MSLWGKTFVEEGKKTGTVGVACKAVWGADPSGRQGESGAQRAAAGVQLMIHMTIWENKRKCHIIN